MGTTTAARNALATALVAATVLLSGCAMTTVVGVPTAAPVSGSQIPVEPVAMSGDMPPGDLPGDLLGQAADSTRSAGTARFALSFEALVAGVGESSPFSATSNGVIDFDRQVSEAELTLAASGLPGGTTRTITVDGNLYQQAAGSDRWTKTPLTSSQPGPGNEYSQASPAQQLDLLQKAAKGNVTEVGPDQVRGTPVRHFTLRLDLTDLLGVTATTTGGPGATPAIPATVDAFVDDQGRLRKVETRVRRALTRVEYYDFGTPVAVQAPDPSIVDVAQR